MVGMYSDFTRMHPLTLHAYETIRVRVRRIFNGLISFADEKAVFLPFAKREKMRILGVDLLHLRMRGQNINGILRAE